MEKREAILNSALELFITNGFDKTSTAQISSNAGVGTGTLFNYFKTKVELINELFLSIKNETNEEISRISEHEMITEDAMKLLWRLLISWGLKNQDKMRFMRQFSSSPYIINLTREQQKAESLLLKSQTLKAVEAGILKEHPYDFIVQIIFSLINVVIFHISGLEKYDDSVIDSYFPVVWDMIKA